MQTSVLEELLKAGVHFGHQTRRWHPKMKPFIFGAKNKLHIIDLEQTAKRLAEAQEVVRAMAAEGKMILFVGSKKQAKDVIKKAATSVGMPHVTERWLGGTFTNFASIKNLIKRFKRLKEQKATGELRKYTKREQLGFDEEIVKLEKSIGGIEMLDRMPGAIIVVGVREERNAIAEAHKKNIPVIALIDTNCDPMVADYPIPANDDAVKSIDYIVAQLAAAIEQGKKAAKPADVPAS